MVESLTKNNEKLHKKLNAAVKEITTFEEELQKVQRQNQRLEVKLRHSNAQIQNYKGDAKTLHTICLAICSDFIAIVQRNKADFDLEIAALSQKLQTNLSTVKSVTDAGDILLEDLDALKRKLKASSCTLNWTKFKVKTLYIHKKYTMYKKSVKLKAKNLKNYFFPFPFPFAFFPLSFFPLPFLPFFFNFLNFPKKRRTITPLHHAYK